MCVFTYTHTHIHTCVYTYTHTHLCHDLTVTCVYRRWIYIRIHIHMNRTHMYKMLVTLRITKRFVIQAPVLVYTCVYIDIYIYCTYGH